MFRVPIKILDDVRIDRLEDEQEVLSPPGLHEQDPHLYEQYSLAIYARLEEPGVLDPTEDLYLGLLEIYNSRRDGYELLKAILASTSIMIHAKDLGRLSTPPTAQHGETLYQFACNLTEFYRGQKQAHRT